jgi:hypothetical protein
VCLGKSRKEDIPDTNGATGNVLQQEATYSFRSRSMAWRQGPEDLEIHRPGVIFIAVGFSALVAVSFGFWPAHKASRLDPIMALRFE